MSYVYDYQGLPLELNGMFDTPQNYGAIGDGVADDITAIQAAIESNKGGTVFFPEGVYAISSPIKTYPSDDNFTNLLLHPNAVIVATGNIPYLLDIGGISETFTRYSGSRKKFIAGGVYKADNGKVTSAAVHFDNQVYDVDFSNARIHTVNCAGIILGSATGTQKSTDAYIHHLIIRHSPVSNTSAGIIVYSHDNSISDTRIYYNKIGIQFYGGSTYVNNIHTLANNLQNDSISFDVHGTNVFFTNTYGDSENTFMKLSKNGSSVPEIMVNNCQYYSYRTIPVTYFDIADYARIKINGLYLHCRSGNTHVGLKFPYNSFNSQMKKDILDVNGLMIINAEYMRNGDPLKGMVSSDKQLVFSQASSAQTVGAWYHIGTFQTNDIAWKSFEFTCSGKTTAIPLNVLCSSSGVLSVDIGSGTVITDDTSTYEIGFSLNNSGFNANSNYPLIDVYLKVVSGNSIIQNFLLKSHYAINISTPTARGTTELQTASVTPSLVYTIDCNAGTIIQS